MAGHFLNTHDDNQGVPHSFHPGLRCNIYTLYPVSHSIPKSIINIPFSLARGHPAHAAAQVAEPASIFHSRSFDL